MSNREIEILCIGNELLIGKVVNTNASWLAKRATLLGIIVKRITVVGDDLAEIGTALHESLRRQPHFIIVTGGLGPTFDDKTLEGIARALNRKWEVNEKALDMVKRKFESSAKEARLEKVEMTPPRVKMAKLPDDSKPLQNPLGTAPGVLINIDSTVLIALPGVPPEMEAIFNESVAPMLKQAAGKTAFFEASLYAEKIGESRVAPFIDKVMNSNPEVYIKSHPRFENDQQSCLELHFSTTADEAKIAKDRLSKAIIQLSELIKENGGKVKTFKNI
jgi:molybdenum cofactor synthesis domain-containing protein